MKVYLVQKSSGWPPHPTEFVKDKNGINSVSFTDTELNFVEVLIKTNPQQI